MTGPLYLNAEGYEPEVNVSVNTILGTVFSEVISEEERRAKLLVDYNPKNLEDVEYIMKHEFPEPSKGINGLIRRCWFRDKLMLHIRKFP